MQANSQPPTDVVEDIFSLCKYADPVEGYLAGNDDCQGKLFMPDEASIRDLLLRIEALEARLAEIVETDLRTSAARLLDSIRVGFLYDRPDEQPYNCALALWYIILKNADQKPFVADCLRQVVEILSREYTRWSGKPFSGEMSKAAVDSCEFLSAVLSILEKRNPHVAPGISEAHRVLGQYRSVFPSHNSSNLEELFAFFESKSPHASATNGYQEFLDRMFGYSASADEILAQSSRTLDKELVLVRETLVPKLVKHLGVTNKTPLGEVYSKMSEQYEIKKDVVGEAGSIMHALNKFTDTYIQDLGLRPEIMPEEAPAFLEPLITSGATIAIDYLRDKPDVRIYVNANKSKSWLTLLNVLVHEAAHAYHPLILQANSSIPKLSKVRTTLAIPFMEATAFHRELELFDAVKESKDNEQLSRIEWTMLAIFDKPRFPLDDDVNAFELETRVWRIIRALRAICDVEVNLGRKTYVEFIKWASGYTTLNKQFIHDECFPFLSFPGYTPSYSFCGVQYEELQSKAAAKGISQMEFNTKANRMGLWPWPICVTRMQGFTKSPGTE